MARTPHPVDVTADLTLTIDGQPITVESYTDTVFVNLPSIRAASALARTGLRRADRLDRLLRDLDVTVVFRIDGTPVARIGAAARPGPLARIAPIQPDARGVLRTALAAPVRALN
ncbi:hypothetical protein ACFQPA_08355 [Halomarina halobia]|uniref:Peptide ABC transporter ATP-binding protein n=1 Tax=Halomarina halobia TaxID=3033386 RepID=A0ABD6ABE2_9EURY|nr:hypothetical protein [Halomarina sp. PSR21]